MPPSTTTTITQTETRTKLPTFDEIRRAVPDHCFERSIPKAVSFLILDFIIIAGLYYAVPYFEYFGFIGLFAWYWVMGMFLSSLFVVGHDCGHGTFSDYEWVNDIFGHIAHAPILAPYWPWQKSHRQHHQYTAHLEKDKGHPWVTAEEYEERDIISKHFSKFPLSGFIRWQPIYTMVGLPDGSHFWPYSKLFTTTTDRVKCVVSGSLCLLCAIAAFHVCDYSVYTFVKYYYIPLLFQGFWMVLITYLQHQNEDCEVYEQDEWNFVRGQVQTIDHSYGFYIDTLLHHITDGHVAHHFFFTRIPHYHLMEATQAISKVLKPYGVYKSRRSIDFVWEFLALNAKLSYLVGKGSGVLRYPVASYFKKEGKKSQ